MKLFDSVIRIGGPLRTDDAQRMVAGQSAQSGAALTGSYLAMNAAATLIAGFGLFENSPAVIIGAMLIAMLFGPIVGIALALAEADMMLLGRSAMAEVGAAWVLAIRLAIEDRDRQDRDTRPRQCFLESVKGPRQALRA
jgi:uncharacterized membrane protein